MNQSFNNIALFIKRAEEYQTKEFIIQAFAKNNIGKVSEVRLIKKHNNFGKNYNGVIVIFEGYYNNSLVQKLLDEMVASEDGTTKFYFEKYRYWVINVHRQKLPECEQVVSVDPSLSDTDKIEKLEKMVKSLLVQNNYLQIKQEKYEKLIMELEDHDTRYYLINIELRSQLEEKEYEIQMIKDEFAII